MKSKILNKKIFSAIIICLLLFVSAFTLFACNGGKNGDPFAQLDSLFETIQSEKTADGMFLTQTDNGVESQFSLNYYFAHTTYNYYNRLFIIPMNYLYNNYQDLARLEKIDKISSQGQKAINSLSKNVEGLAQSYRQSFEKFKVYTNLKQHSNKQVVIEGAITIYKSSLKDMFDYAYASALDLAQIKDVVLDDFKGLEVTDRELTTADTAVLRDMLVLDLANDFYKTMIVNLEMQDCSSLEGNAEIDTFATFCTNLKNQTQNLLRLQALSSLGNLSGAEDQTQNTWTNTQVSAILQMKARLDQERIMLDKALDTFNLNDFYDGFLCNLDNYSRKVKYAKQYYREITQYFTTWTQSYMDYLQTTLGE